MSNVELLWKLVENGAVAGLVLFYDGRDEGDQFVPKLQVVLPGPGLFRIALRIVAAGFLEM